MHCVAVVGHVQCLVLKLSGFSTYLELIRPRLYDPHFSALTALPLRGSFINNPADAQEFFRVGLPFWLFQPYTPSIVIRQVVDTARPISSALSLDIAFPGLESAMYDPSGAYQDPSKWPAAMLLHTSLLFASGTLPSILSPEPQAPAGSSQPPAKRTKIDDPRGASSSSSTASKKTHRGKRGGSRQQRGPHPAFVFTPSPDFLPVLPPSWSRALQSIPALANPPKQAACYFFPPPFLFAQMDAKGARYVHNWLRIRTFARQRLVDVTIRGDPLRIEEWRDSLYGEYGIPRTVDPQQVPGKKYTDSERAAFARKIALRGLFAGAGSLPSYDVNCAPLWGAREISAVEASNDARLRAQVVWELHEINWRCELRELDRVMLGDRFATSAMLQWERGDMIARVWSSEGALSVFPLYPDSPAPDLWGATPVGESIRAHAELVRRRSRLLALVDVMSRWPDIPQSLWAAQRDLAECRDSLDFSRLEADVVAIYVQCFVARFGRLPIPPAHPPSL